MSTNLKVVVGTPGTGKSYRLIQNVIKLEHQNKKGSNIMIETEHNNKAIVKFEGDEIRKLTVNDKETRSFKDGLWKIKDYRIYEIRQGEDNEKIN